MSEFSANSTGEFGSIRLPFRVWQRITMVITPMLTSKGVAGVARAVAVILMEMASSFHVPATAVLLPGVDTIAVMGRRLNERSWQLRGARRWRSGREAWTRD